MPVWGPRSAGAGSKESQTRGQLRGSPPATSGGGRRSPDPAPARSPSQGGQTELRLGDPLPAASEGLRAPARDPGRALRHRFCLSDAPTLHQAASRKFVTASGTEWCRRSAVGNSSGRAGAPRVDRVRSVWPREGQRDCRRSPADPKWPGRVIELDMLNEKWGRHSS